MQSIPYQTSLSLSHDVTDDVVCHAKQGVNPLCDVKFIFQKSDRTVAFGLTSMRTMFHLHCDSKFNKYFTTAWSKLKKERQSWKTNNNYGSSNEWNLLREPSVCKKGESVIDAVCRVLPSYEEIELHLEDYFKGPVFKTFKIVDPTKTIRDLEACFVKGPPSTRGSNHPILDLVYESPQTSTV
ncbi:hypothetical protein SEUBUCD646_0I00130 [Saccharomyces eubayanus]|nr:hypothetical protein SEUBUCD646_0I00130 [Saccharomyces eubayanus]